MPLETTARRRTRAPFLFGALAGLGLLAADPILAQVADGSRGAGRSDLATADDEPGGPDIDVKALFDSSLETILDTRIIGGSLAQPGQWPSVAAIYAKLPSGRAGNFCGGTVIGREWVLTAAHCVGAMASIAEENGPGVTFFVRENTSDLQAGGHDATIVEVIPHKQYDAKRVLNDIALLHVSAPLQAPRQKLIAQSLTGEVLRPARMSTVVGYGLTKEKGKSSPQLRQVDVPIVAKDECTSVYGSGFIIETNFCAGERKGGKDSCQGDSGGPLFMPAADGEQLQSGVVSWGKGCARPRLYGVYTSVGHFQDWIRDRVPDVVFIERGAPRPSTGGGAEGVDAGASTLAGDATDTPKPSAIAQVSVDFAEGTSVKVGQFVEVRVTSSANGLLVVYNENPDGHSYQLYPSKVFPAPGADPTLARIEAGKPLSIPSAAQRDQGYRFVIRPPTGTNKLRAVVVPESTAMRDIVRANFAGGDIRDLSAVMGKIVQAELGSRGPEAVKVEPVDRGVGERTYQILPK